MQIRQATDADRTAWDDFVLRHAEGTAYQLFAWQEAVGRAYGFRGAYLLAHHGATVCGILPLVDFRVPFVGRTLISLPYCDAGGVLADSEGVARALLAQAKVLAQKHGAGIQIRALQPLPAATGNLTDKVRMVLELPTSSDQLLASLEAKVRSQVKKPVRDGLSVKLGTEELINDFYQVFAENMRDLGSPVHSRQWIEAIVAAYGERVRVAVVYTPDGTPSAAGVVLIHPTTMSIPWASSLRRYNHLNPNMLLYWIFLSLAIDSGCKQFDFGRSTPGEGTYRFKEQWGARPQPLYWHDLAKNGWQAGTAANREDAPGRHAARQRAAEFWRRMPLAAFTCSGCATVNSGTP